MRPPIDHLISFLPCQDLAAQDDFYLNLLGLTLNLDQHTCRIYGVVSGASIGFCTGLTPITPTDQVILTFVTGELKAWHEFLVGQGVPLDGAPRSNPRFHIDHFFAQDPAGYRVEFQTFTDPRWNPR